MKKILVLAVVALSFATGLCRSIDDVFNAFPEADNVQLVNMPGLLDMIQSKFDAKSKEKNGAKSIIESVKMHRILKQLFRYFGKHRLSIR